jgi:hypothetical protein
VAVKRIKIKFGYKISMKWNIKGKIEKRKKKKGIKNNNKKEWEPN